MNDDLSQASPGGQRERALMLWGAALMILIAGLLIALLWYLLPGGYYQPLIELDAVPPSDQPYFIAFNDASLIVVNTGETLYVFDAHSTRPTCLQFVHWNSSGDTGRGTGRFEDPCHGAVYAITGENLPYGPPARGLDGYKYEVRDGELWVCLNCPVPGLPAPAE